MSAAAARLDFVTRLPPLWTEQAIWKPQGTTPAICPMTNCQPKRARAFHVVRKPGRNLVYVICPACACAFCLLNADEILPAAT